MFGLVSLRRWYMLEVFELVGRSCSPSPTSSPMLGGSWSQLE